MDSSTFIRGVLAHPRKYTFDHGWERAELRASLTLHVSQRARSICARRHHLQWWRHAGDAGARKGVRPVPARRRHAYFRPTVHERDAQALCPETPKRRCRPVVEAGVVGRSDPPLRAVEELLRRWAQLSRDLNTERDELRAILEILMVFHAVTPS